MPVEDPRTQLSRIWQTEFGGMDSFSIPNTTPDSFSAPTSNIDPTSIPTSLPSIAGYSSYSSETIRRCNQPHPAVVRVVVPEGGATSYGSGTLVDVRENFGLVITNWHVVRDAQGVIEVLFPGGFTSQARAIKLDADWDLAALVVWRPPVDPVKIATIAPSPGDELTICGYGQGMYRTATGRCTDYYAPRPDLPRQMVELDVEARQGDSGGPIFNQQGELAGVLFGAGQGTTLGSFGGRVGSFLATLAPDIGLQKGNTSEVVSCQPEMCMSEDCQDIVQQQVTAHIQPHQQEFAPVYQEHQDNSEDAWTSNWPTDDPEASALDSPGSATPMPSSRDAYAPRDAYALQGTDWRHISRNSLFEQMKTVLAAVGLLAIALQVLRAAR